MNGLDRCAVRILRRDLHAVHHELDAAVLHGDGAVHRVRRKRGAAGQRGAQRQRRQPLKIDFPMFSASLCEKVFQRAGEQGGGVPPFSTPPENKKSVQARQKSRPYTEFHTKAGYVKMQKKHNARGQNTREVLYSDGASYIIRVRCGVMPLCMVVSAPAQVMGCCNTP